MLSPFLNQYFFSSGTQDRVIRCEVTVCSDFLNIDLPQFRGYPFLSRFSSAPGMILGRNSCFSSTFDNIFHRSLREIFSSRNQTIAGRTHYIQIGFGYAILFLTDQSPRHQSLGEASYPVGDSARRKVRWAAKSCLHQRRTTRLACKNGDCPPLVSGAICQDSWTTGAFTTSPRCIYALWVRIAITLHRTEIEVSG